MEEEERRMRRRGEESSMETQGREGLLWGEVNRTEQVLGRKGNSRGPWGRNKEQGWECPEFKQSVQFVCLSECVCVCVCLCLNMYMRLPF